MQISKLEKISEGNYKVYSLPCPECGEVAHVKVSSKWVYDYNQGATLSELLPYPKYLMELREKFISGLCAPCWDKVMMGVEA